MKRVRVVGGGLTGILAAFQAVRLGASEVVLQERFAALGGVARPKIAHGRELRDGCIYFGPPGEPVRAALEAEGLIFEEVRNRMASVSPGAVATRDFAGPAVSPFPLREEGVGGGGDSPSRLFHPHPKPLPPKGEGLTLADRLALYPAAIAEPLSRYVQWHVGVAPERLAADTAIPLAINRVYPLDVPADALIAAKRDDPACDALYGLPPQLWGRTANRTASLPSGGFAALFDGCARALTERGVRVETGALVSPRQALVQAVDGDEVLVWAASPTPLFKAVGLATPSMVRKSFATYVFRADFAGELPFYLQNFTAEGVVFRFYVYGSGGEALLAAECVAEADDAALRGEIARLMAGFSEEGLRLRDLLSVSIQPRWIYHSCETLAGLSAVSMKLGEVTGGRFVAGAWAPYAKAEKLAQVNAALADALRAQPAADPTAMGA